MTHMHKFLTVMGFFRARMSHKRELSRFETEAAESPNGQPMKMMGRSAGPDISKWAQWGKPRCVASER